MRGKMPHNTARSQDAECFSFVPETKKMVFVQIAERESTHWQDLNWLVFFVQFRERHKYAYMFSLFFGLFGLEHFRCECKHVTRHFLVFPLELESAHIHEPE